MRRIVLLALGVVLAAALAAPTLAAKPTRQKSETASANAFWYSSEAAGPGMERTTVWYVGVFKDGEGIWSDLYKEVVLCETSEEGECQTESFAIGFSDLSGEGDSFSVENDLAGAEIVGTYELQESDGEGNPVGDPESTQIVAHLEGVSDLSSEKSKSTFRTGCSVFRFSSKGSFRQAEATGSVNGVDLGETYDAWLSSGTSSSFERTC